ncbi:MAG: hypothetical protein SGPRY_010350 [Prymnesium sp.]
MADPPLLAAGVVTAPQFVERRAALRSSWLRWPNVGPSRPIRAHFVLRSAHAPPKLQALLADEARKHGDLLRVEVAWNETRLRGPLIAVARWFEYALATYPSAPLIGKMDDDVYVHAPRLEQLLRAAIAGVARPDRLYLGSITYFNWFPRIFERSGFGWSYPMAHRHGAYCKNLSLAEARCSGRGCGTCVGPFPFASGYLAVFSTPLVVELSNSTVIASDERRIQAASSLITRTGGRQNKIMEDVWLGSLLHRQQLAMGERASPISYVAISNGLDNFLVYDAFGLKLSSSKIVQLERFLATHDFMLHSHCPVRLRLMCQSGCGGFMAPVERARASKDSEFAHAVFATFNNSGVCRSANSEAEMCRFVKPMEVDDKELAPCCKDLKCTMPVNLMDRAYSAENRARADSRN